MTLEIELGSLTVPLSSGELPLDFCIVWLNRAEWAKITLGRQRDAYAFIERHYKSRHIFYCFRMGADTFEINDVRPASSGSPKISTEALRKIFNKYIQPMMRRKALTSAQIAIPRLA